MAANLRFFQQKYNQAAAHCHTWPETLPSGVLWNSCYLRPLLKPNMKLGTYAETKGSGKAVGGGGQRGSPCGAVFTQEAIMWNHLSCHTLTSVLGIVVLCASNCLFPLHLPQFKVQLMKFEKSLKFFDFFQKFQFFKKFENFLENFRFFQKRPFF